MIKQLMLAAALLAGSMGAALAQVDVNKADAAALDGIKGIGPSMSRTILEERGKAGPFKDWADFQKRIKGMGDKRAAKLSEAGLQVNGQAKDGAAAARTEDKAGAKQKTAAKPEAAKAAG